MEPQHNRVHNHTHPTLILRAHAYTPIMKPLNGPLPGGKTSHMLKLGTITYTYKQGKHHKDAESILYYLKGLRGAIREKAATLCTHKGFEVCHTSDRDIDSHGNSLIPQGYHKLGSCLPNNECIIHSIFGSLSHPSKISVYAQPITNIPQRTYYSDHEFQTMHIATENRIVLTYDGRVIQDFKERYVSGFFTFELDVTQCTLTELGLLINTVINIDRLGAGYNAGYGRVTIKAIQLAQQTITRTPIWNGDIYTITTKNTRKPLKNKIDQALKAWEQQ